MTRPLRIEFVDALYHVTSRGNMQENIYRNDDDRNKFLALLTNICVQNNTSSFFIYSSTAVKD